MRFKPPNCKRLQGAADARRRARRRTFVLQVPDNKADAVPCERLQGICCISPEARLSKCRVIAVFRHYPPVNGPPLPLVSLLSRVDQCNLIVKSPVIVKITDSDDTARDQVE
jgi:hypothetical protein